VLFRYGSEVIIKKNQVETFIKQGENLSSTVQIQHVYSISHFLPQCINIFLHIIPGMLLDGSIWQGKIEFFSLHPPLPYIILDTLKQLLL